MIEIRYILYWQLWFGNIYSGNDLATVYFIPSLAFENLGEVETSDTPRLVVNSRRSLIR